MAPFRGLESIFKKRGYGHRANTAGNWSNSAGNFAYRLKINVANQPFPLGMSRVVYLVCANVNDHRSRFDHIGGQEAGPAHGGYNDICPSCMSCNIASSGMADCPAERPANSPFCPLSRSRRAFCPYSMATSIIAMHCDRFQPSESRAPLFTRLSSARLFSTWPSMRRAKSYKLSRTPRVRGPPTSSPAPPSTFPTHSRDRRERSSGRRRADGGRDAGISRR